MQVSFHQFKRKYRCLSQGGNLAETGPLVTVGIRQPTSQHVEKN